MERWRRENVFSDNIILENKKMAFYWPQIKMKAMQWRKTIFTERVKNIKIKRNKIMKDHFKRGKMYLKRWEVLKKKRLEVEKIQRRIYNQKQYQKIWIVFTRQYWFLKIIAEKFNVVKDEKINEIRKQVFGMRMMRKMRRCLNSQSPFQSMRLLSKVVYSVNTFTEFTKNTFDNRAKNILKGFMTSSSNKFQIQNKFLIFLNIVLKLQKSWNRYQEK